MAAGASITIAAISTCPKMEMEAIAAPETSVPVSPGKILAGYQLYLRNAMKAADRGKASKAASHPPNRMHRTLKAPQAIAPIPASSPLKPASMLVRFEAVATPNGMRIGPNIPKLIKPKIGNHISV